MKTLLIINGDSAADLLTDAGVKADILPWRDCLHVGPVPQTKSDADLIKLRAEFLAKLGGETSSQINMDMSKRDKFIVSHSDYDEIELWFEHDLYDQLQLIQIVDMLARRGRSENITLIQAPTYLGMQQPDNILRFKDLALPINAAMTDTATKVWSAFREPSPEAFAGLIDEKIAGFLFLPAAIKRMLEELPGADGLNRTQRQIIYSINRGVSRPGPLFARALAMEEAAFWGDTGFFNELSRLAHCAHPLVRGLSEPFVPEIMQDGERRKAYIQSSLELTSEGLGVLSGKHDFADLNEIDFWWGGSRITNENLWRWDAETGSLTLQKMSASTLH